MAGYVVEMSVVCESELQLFGGEEWAGWRLEALGWMWSSAAVTWTNPDWAILCSLTAIVVAVNVLGVKDLLTG